MESLRKSRLKTTVSNHLKRSDGLAINMTLTPWPPKHVMWQRVIRGTREFKVRNPIS